MVKLKGAEDIPMYFGTSADIMKLASQMRKDQTPAEKILWEKLRKRQLEGLKFRRQHPVNCFIADFYCHEAKLIIEVDGNVHDDPRQNERDIEREGIIKSLGLRIIRFTNKEIFNNVEDVIKKIKDNVNR
jgi:imidazole glycerol-phosphate synthase subunit HisF